MIRNNSPDIGRRLTEARIALGMNQEAMAGAAGVSREMWGKYERGASVPGGEVLAALAALGVDVQRVLLGDRDQQRLKVPASPPLSPRESALLDNYRHAGEDGRRAIECTSAALAQPVRRKA